MPELFCHRDLVCFSHLRWHFVTQRPQHLLSRAARDRRVFFFEEPFFSNREELPGGAHLELLPVSENLIVVRPRLVHGVDADAAQAVLLQKFLAEHRVLDYDAWIYNPMARAFTQQLQPKVLVYDCMDELKNFLNAPAELVELEQELLLHADVVFTGGRSLYESKRTAHPHVFAFPSSIEAEHFASALLPGTVEPSDQSALPHPRAGFYGVIDERFDIELLRAVAALRPETQFVMLGPVVKIDPATLPQASNIHYLGGKSYAELPGYLAGWDVALLPFALNDATRYISPTKTPEYLAAGRRVVSTPIHDVVADYGEAGLVEIAATSEEFAEAMDRCLQPAKAGWRQSVDEKLGRTSWDATWKAMQVEMDQAEARRAAKSSKLLQSTALSAVGQDRRGRALPTPVAEADMTKRALISTRARHAPDYDVLVVGAGFAGSVLAERLASQLHQRVLLIDKREHVAGNAYDHLDEHGILVHRYGPHIFHTNSDSVVQYLSRFTEWRPYEHRVLASVRGKLLPVPINLRTINELYDLKLDAAGMQQFLGERTVQRDHIRTSEDIVLSRVGQELYEAFFRNYTRKQWGLDPSELDASVAGRIPVRYNTDDRYFGDSFQAMPLDGYTRMFERMLDHPRITVQLGVSYEEVRKQVPGAHVVFTGPIDEFFGFRFGPLPYRSLEFRHEHHRVARFQSAGVVNHPNEHEYTRVTEFKTLTGQQHAGTSIVYEYPQASGDPYYPIPRPENAALYARYKALAESAENVTFCGRLANYKYFNMDQVVAQALLTFERFAERSPSRIPAAATRAFGMRGAPLPVLRAAGNGTVQP